MRVTAPIRSGGEPAGPAGGTVWACLEQAARAGGLAVAADENRLDYPALRDRAARLAGGMGALGVGPGDVVSYQLPNWTETIVVLLAVLRLGAIANPIVPIYRERELGFILRQTRSALLIVPGLYRGFDHAAMAAGVAQDSGTRIATCRGDGPLRIEDMATDPHPGLATDPDAEAFLLYTSGTEGAPKGVRHSQRGLVADAASIVAAAGIGRADSIFLPTPLTHISGMIYGHLVPLVAGIPLHLADRWDPASAAATIERHGCTIMTGATPFLQGLVDHLDVGQAQLATLRHFRCGGADVPPALIRAAQAKGIAAIRTYGCTEFPTITGLHGDDPRHDAETDGRIHPHIALRLAAEDGDAPATGEIQVRGAEMFLGYRDDALDAKAFTADGWYRTGDLGSMSGDGFLTVTGRRKDIIIRKGENISAKEVEDVLTEHPDIESAAVVGMPDGVRGEMVVAVCVARGERRPPLDRIVAHFLDSGIARQKIPERIEYRDAMPVTAAGKIRKVELRAWLAGRR